MTFPFTIEIRIEPELEGFVPDGNGNIEVTLSANGREAKYCFDAAGDTHGTLQDALLSLLGYHKDEVGQKPWQPAPRASTEPQRMM